MHSCHYPLLYFMLIFLWPVVPSRKINDYILFILRIWPLICFLECFDKNLHIGSRTSWFVKYTDLFFIPKVHWSWLFNQCCLPIPPFLFFGCIYYLQVIIPWGLITVFLQLNQQCMSSQAHASFAAPGCAYNLCSVLVICFIQNRLRIVSVATSCVAW
jgi:hypothetical protein